MEEREASSDERAESSDGKAVVVAAAAESVVSWGAGLERTEPARVMRRMDLVNMFVGDSDRLVTILLKDYALKE